MERKVIEHEIKTEYKLIRQITHTYVTVNDEERLWDTHRGSQLSPGALVSDGYVATVIANLPADVIPIAEAVWTEEIKSGHEAYLKSLPVESI